MTPTDLLTVQEATRAPAKLAAARAWLGSAWVLHDLHPTRADLRIKHASTWEMLRPLWQRTRGVGDRVVGLVGWRQHRRLETHYRQQNERDLAPPWVSRRLA